MGPVVAALAVAAALGVIAGAASPKFFPDDPIRVDDDRAVDASKVQPTDRGNLYDFVEHTFFAPGDREPRPAVNVNTIGEVPDSSWFTNRIGARPVSIAEIVRGPDRVERLSIDGWDIVEGKDEGLQPGLRVADPATNHIYHVEFDPPSNPEMASGAEMVGTALYHAFGYHVVDVYLVEFDPRKTRIRPGATIRDTVSGKRRPLTWADIDAALGGAARLPNGAYRALAIRFADGQPLGSFQYHGTRPDDPNDIFPHEHRRELRGSRVFAAWLNHDDSRRVNSLDMLTESSEGAHYVKHFMFDFGSIMGSGTAFAQSPRAGNEYLFEPRPGFLTLATLGLWVRPWMRVRYPDVPASVGRFESDFFHPTAWRPEYPNPAFANMRPDDAFWGARIVAQFTGEAIRAIVEKAQYSDPRATEYVTRTLVERRDKVLRAWLNGVNPIDEVRLDRAGRLTFENAAVRAGVAQPAACYRLRWYRFDNATGAHAPAGESIVTTPAADAPAALLAAGGFVAAAIVAESAEHTGWARPARVYFRRGAGGWELVGLERGHDRWPDDEGT